MAEVKRQGDLLKRSRKGARSPVSDKPIPDKRYLTISEVSELYEIKPHVLRYWEEEFPQLKPVRRSNRRYYRRSEVLLIRQIKRLLYEQGYTIPGARRFLEGDKGKKEVSRSNDLLQQVIDELEALHRKLR